MSFSENGFFGNDAQKSRELFRQNNAEYVNHFEAVNRASHGLINTGILNTTDGQQLFIAGLFLRSVTVFQAMIILGEYGIPSEMKTMLRSLLELRFQIQAIIVAPITAKRLIFKAEQKVKARLSALRDEQWLDERNPKRVSPHDRLAAQNTALKEMERDILTECPALADKNGRLKKLDFAELAEIADLKKQYDIVYSSLCDAAHSSAKYLDEMASFDKEDYFRGFKYPEREEHLLVFLLGGTGIHLDNLESTAQILKTQPPTELASLREQNRNLKAKAAPVMT